MRSLPVACHPSAFTASDDFTAHVLEGRRLLSLALERRELPNGWALRLPSDDAVFVACATWILGERRCCPFFTFSLECLPGHDAFWMRITGPDGAKDVLTHELT